MNAAAPSAKRASGRDSSPAKAEAAAVRTARIVGTTLGLAITAYIFADLLRPRFVAVNIMQMDSDASGHANPAIVSAIHLFLNLAISLPSLYLAWRVPIDLRRVGRVAPILGGLVLVAALSLLGETEIKTVSYVLLLANTFVAAALLAAAKGTGDAGFTAFMVTVALGSAAALLVAIGLHEYAWGRLASRAGPTYWGMVALGCFGTCWSIPNGRVRWLIVLLVIVALLLTSARGAIVAMAVGGFARWAIAFARTPRGRRGYYLVGLALAVIVLAVSAQYIADHVFQASDARRGLGSGATGRSFAWAQAWGLFKAHPWLGVGYRRHEMYITVATSAHEAYLAVLAEMGLPGFALYLLLVGGATLFATAEAVRDGGETPIAAAVFMWSYLSIGLTENLALATGLALPLTMMFVAVRAWRAKAPSAGRPGRRRPLSSRGRRIAA